MDISINIGDKLGVFFTPHSVGKPDHREVIFGGLMVGKMYLKQDNYLGPKGPRRGKQDVPDIDVGDISGVNRSKVGVKDRPKGVVKHGQSRKSYNILCKIIDNLYPVKAPSADGIGNTIILPRSVTYLGRLTILPMKK